MERLLELAKKVAAQAAVYGEDSVSDGVSFENCTLKDIGSRMASGVSLLILKDGRLGSAYTRNLIDRQKLLEDALASFKNGVEADYELPLTRSVPQLSGYDPAIGRLTNAQMVDECGRICALLKEKTEAQLNIQAERSTLTLRILNSKGTDLTARLSSYDCGASLIYPGSYASVERSVSGKSFVPFPEEELGFMAGLFNASQREARPQSGRIRVLFLPESMAALVSRLTAATNGKSVYEKVSPLKDRVGQQVLSDRVTMTDEPLDESRPGARAFDDEGTPCRRTALFERGVLRSFYYDLFYAAKSGVPPTGHGYRGGITTKTMPGLGHVRLGAGSTSFDEMLGMMESGVIVAGMMGAHSGNILNGDYSIGLSPGLAVEKGEVTGRVRDAMVAGNVYETMKNVVAVQDKAYDAWMGRFPAILFDGVSFTAGG